MKKGKPTNRALILGRVLLVLGRMGLFMGYIALALTVFFALAKKGGAYTGAAASAPRDGGSWELPGFMNIPVQVIGVLLALGGLALMCWLVNWVAKRSVEITAKNLRLTELVAGVLLSAVSWMAAFVVFAGLTGVFMPWFVITLGMIVLTVMCFWWSSKLLGKLNKAKKER